MSIVEWDASLSVHNDELDAQHKVWLGILNKLHDAMMNDSADALLQSKAEAMKAMLDYTRFHFGAEEAYMNQIGYPEVAVHKRMHRHFIEGLETSYEDLKAGRAVLGSQVVKVLQTWLLEHIANEDRKYAGFAG